MLLSGAMMLDWLGEQHELQDMIAAAEMIETAVENAFISARLLPYELGGDAGTQTVYAAVVGELEQLLK
jgi:3-isopropylmalate dehydrogenase